jgi:hypothetical protein
VVAGTDILRYDYDKIAWADQCWPRFEWLLLTAPAREFRWNSVASLRERSRAKYSADTSAARQSVKPNPGLLDSADALNDPVPLAIKVGVICALVQRSASLVARLNRAYMMRLH